MDNIQAMVASPPQPAAGLAAEQEPLAAAGQYLTFRLGAEEYGIDICKVQEIRSYEAPMRMAGAPPFVKGVVDLRGVIVPIVDLRLAFALEQARYDDFTVTIILNVAQRVVGMVVDSVSDVTELTAGQIRPAPEFNGSLKTLHILGLGSLKTGEAERLLILSDIDRLMTSAEMGLVHPASALN